ncbi:MAG TPA: hypothetical protein VEH77_15210, partial [Roseiarcus sp.]|nr:hypothetical protein [Roseiarcus sp.]
MAENKSNPPPPAPQDEEPPLAESAPDAGGAAPTPRKERRRGRHGFTLFLATVGLLATALGGAAIVFRNQDERLGAIADAIEQAAQNPKNFVLKEKEELGAWLAEKLPHGEDGRETVSAPPAGDGASKPAPSAESAPSAATPGWAAPRETERQPTELKAQVEAEPAPQAAAPSVPPPGAVGSAEIASLAKRLDAIEAEVRAANDAAAEARRAAEAKSAAERTESPAAPTPETKTLVAALEARLDEL